MQRRPSTPSKHTRLPTRGADGDFEDEFHRLLGRLVCETARFDFHVGLQLNWLAPHAKTDVSKFLKPSGETLASRLGVLQEVVSGAFVHAGPGAMAEFNAWFKKASAARALRNSYSHGRWGVPGKWAESSEGSNHPRVPMLAFVPLDWDLTPDQPDRSVYMTIEDFREEVEGAVGVFYEFFKLTQKYLPHVR